MIRLLLITASITFLSCKPEGSEKPLTTHYFEFHSNYWINLHHFLYQKAEGGQLRKIQEDGFVLLPFGEEQIWNSLTVHDRETMEKCIDYYKKNLIRRDLLRDLSHLKTWLQQQDQATLLTDTTYSSDFTDVLNDASAIYREKFWTIHNNLNSEVLNRHLESIRTLETSVIPTMEDLSQNQWPDTVKVRVDLTVYANWAGAYTSSRPHMNIVISSIHPLDNTSTFVETIFHEGSHLLYLFGSSIFRDKIYERASQLEMEFPTTLWHASLFYLCGRATQDELQKLGIEHTLVMDKRGIFKNYNTPEFRNVMEDYYQRRISMDSTVGKMLDNIKEPSNNDPIMPHN